MIASIPWWQWAFTSVLVPIVVGVSAAYAGHYLSLRKARFELRIVEHRTTYEELIPALVDLAESDARYVRQAYHDFGSQSGEDAALALDDEWANRRRAASAVVQRVLLRGELGASRAVLDALEASNALHSVIASRYNDEEDDLDYGNALEMDAAASKRALEDVRKAISRET